MPTQGIDYSLALQLKNAGFPQNYIKGDTARHPKNPDGTAYIPTLSELIEACGEGVFYLGRNTKGEWLAEKGLLLEKETEFGSTPEEAVARLWLALNQPNK